MAGQDIRAVINIAPAVEARLWKGAAFTGQVILPVWNNMVGQMDYIRAGVLTLSQEFGLPGGAFGRVTVGNFTNNRMGADLKLRYVTPDDRWMFGLEGGVTGSSTFYEGKWQVSNWKRGERGGGGSFPRKAFQYGFQLGRAPVYLWRLWGAGGLHPPFRTDDGRLVCHVHGGRGERRFPFAVPCLQGASRAR